jgi:ABC-type dipeptide/oligopeptide/nickel transport system permease subunit
LSAATGTVVGLVAGYIGGIVQTILMRITDAIMAIPALVLSMLVVMIFKPGVSTVILAVGIGLFPSFVRMVNGQVMSLKQNDYVLAEKMMGAKTPRILFRHIFPNLVSHLIVTTTMTMGAAIMAEASMSFLGIGITAPTAAWGAMCYGGYKYLATYPLISLLPGVLIMLLVFSLNMIGDGLRDALDPRLRGSDS